VKTGVPPLVPTSATRIAAASSQIANGRDKPGHDNRDVSAPASGRFRGGRADQPSCARELAFDDKLRHRILLLSFGKACRSHASWEEHCEATNKIRAGKIRAGEAA